jgi:hypothetical protein
MIRRKHHSDDYRFGREETLRAWIKDWLGDEWWRIEPSQGSTFGLPDGFIIGPNKRVLFTELKVCRIKNGRLLFELTPAQKRNFPKLIAQGARLTIVACEYETNRVWLLRGDERFKKEHVPYFSERDGGAIMITAGKPELLVPSLMVLHGIKPVGIQSADKLWSADSRLPVAVRKYEITTMRFEGHHRLFRIRALRDIPCHGVKSGDIGGFVADESCLTQKGDAWVGGNAQVHKDAKVMDDALVTDNAKVLKLSRVGGNAVVEGEMVVGKGQWVGLKKPV